MRKFIALCLCSFVFFSAFAQNLSSPKFPSLFWEITGNGLKKPSYLFGTMHVSNKMAFHLSDSFYNAIQSCDMVALELNPEFWQRDMVKLDAAQQQLGDFYKDNTSDYLTETSFQIENYYDRLKAALTADPQQINSLLYRTFSMQQDYEENTYLDLYIYQTGRKFGKLAGGVEDYYQTQKILFEAYAAMAKEKNRKIPDTNGEPDYDIDKKIQDAYRRGDLDLLDSLEKISFNSPAYIDKFLYERNKIQANSIDTLLKHYSVFVGVGAAHLPGSKGVIELLRKKGYKLRPVFMQDRDAAAKESSEKLKVPVSFHTVVTDDGLLEMQMPGPLYKMQNIESKNNNDNWQYADMENGAYYMLTRIKTHAGLLNQDEQQVLKKTDSLLYENIPGKIIEKKAITKSGYSGFDITNRTRRGDLQRYNIIVTPFEIFVIKMSGTDDYVNGPEADTFFNSISFKKSAGSWVNFTSASKGFHVSFPSYPDININKFGNDNISRLEYEANDAATGNSYAVWEKTVTNFSFIEQDSFDLSLVEQSLKESDIIDKELSRSFATKEGYETLKMQFACKSGSYINAEAILKGPDYFLLTERTSKKNNLDENFFSSFGFNKIIYPEAETYTDTLLQFKVHTPVKPVLDSSLTNLMYQMLHDETLVSQLKGTSYWPQNEYAMFKSDSTGETILVSLYEFPKYYYGKDSASFWKKQLNIQSEHDAFVYSLLSYTPCDSCEGYKITWRDTNTVRQIINYKILKGNRLYSLYALSDTASAQSSFFTNFFSSFTPLNDAVSSVYTDKTDKFFKDLYSSDSTTKAQARNAIPSVYYGPKNIDRIVSFINKLNYGEEDYFEMKAKFISELGYINDSCCLQKVINALDTIYKQTADTAYFQNEVFWALLSLKTKSSYAELKDLLLQDPPSFEDEDSYSDFFNSLQDTLQLSRLLFPELLQLTTMQDYKEPVIDLLSTLLDSGFVTAKDYESYFSKIYFDAKIEMKKQQNIEEKLLEKQSQQVYDENENDNENNKYGDTKYNLTDINLYANLLLPFYDKDPALPKFFDRLLQSRDTSVQLRTAVLLLKNHRPVPDSVFIGIASKDNYRALLLKDLEEIKRTDLYPLQYKKQELIARSLLLNDSREDEFADIKPEGKVLANINGKKGFVYFFLYKTKKDDDWQIGLSGPQPENLKEVRSTNELTKMTDKKLSGDTPEAEQFNEQLLRLLLKQHKSAARFFEDDENYYNRYFNYGN